MTDETEAPQDSVSGVDETPKRQRRWLRHGLRICILLTIAPVVFIMIAAALMIDQDIAAPSWVKHAVEERAAQVLEGGTVEFGGIFVNVGSDLHPHIRLIDTVLFDASGTQIARISQVEGLISPRGLILRQEVLMQQVALSGAEISLRRAADGSVAVAFGGAGTVGQAANMTGLMDQADQVFEKPALEALESVSATGLIVNFDDARAGRAWTVDGGTLDLDLRGGKTAVRADLTLLSGRATVTTLAFNYDSPRGSRAANIAMSINDAVASDLATQSPALLWLADIEAPISAALRSSLDEGGRLGPLSATLEIGAGALQPNAATQPIRFNAAKAYMTFDPQLGEIKFDQITLDTEWGRLQSEGQALLREEVDGLPGALLGQFRFFDMQVNPAGLYPEPVPIAGAQVDFRLRFDPFALEIGQLAVEDGDASLLSQGNFLATPEGWQAALDVSVDQITLDKILALWPETLKSKSRQWFATNVTGATFGDVNLGVRMTPGQAPQVAVGLAFSGAAIRFMKFLPPLTDGSGTISLIDNEMVAMLEGGHVMAAVGGPLNPRGTVMTIPDIRIPHPPASYDLVIESSITAALSALDQRPLQVMTKAARPVTLADGRARITGRVSAPLRHGNKPDDISYDIAARLLNVRSDQLVPDRVLAATALDVAVNKTQLTISGPMRLGAVQGNGTWTKRFGAEHAGKSNVSATLELSERFLDEFNITLPPGSVNGSGQATIDIALQAGQAPRFALRSDLRGVGLGLPAIGWAKARGAAGGLRVEGTLGAVPDITRLDISGGGLSASGRIALNSDGSLDRVTFNSVQLGNWLNAPIVLRGRGAGRAVGVEIGGGALDMRRAQFGGGGAESGPMRIALDRLQVTEGIALTNFVGDFDGSGGFSGRFTGQVNGETTVVGTVVPQNGRSAVRLQSNDAGGVARAAGLIRNAVGGQMDLTLLPARGAGTFDGNLSVRALRVRDAPSMAALLDAISVVGLLQQMDGQGLAFDEVDAAFNLGPEVVTVTHASAVGPGLGISLDGRYLLTNKTMDFQGVVSPFYLINSVGSVLTRKGEGLIGFNFNLSGSVDNPSVSVNPLSILTPGAFRNIFRRPPPEVNP